MPIDCSIDGRIANDRNEYSQNTGILAAGPINETELPLSVDIIDSVWGLRAAGDV